MDPQGTIAVDDTIRSRVLPRLRVPAYWKVSAPLQRRSRDPAGAGGERSRAMPCGEFGLDLLGESSFRAAAPRRTPGGASARLAAEGSVAALGVDANRAPAGPPRWRGGLIKPTYGAVSAGASSLALRETVTVTAGRRKRPSSPSSQATTKGRHLPQIRCMIEGGVQGLRSPGSRPCWRARRTQSKPG